MLYIVEFGRCEDCDRVAVLSLSEEALGFRQHRRYLPFERGLALPDQGFVRPRPQRTALGKVRREQQRFVRRLERLSVRLSVERFPPARHRRLSRLLALPGLLEGGTRLIDCPPELERRRRPGSKRQRVLGERQRLGVLSLLKEVRAARQPFLELTIVERLSRPIEDAQRIRFFCVEQQCLLGGDDRGVEVTAIERAPRVADVSGGLRRAPLCQTVAIGAPARGLRRTAGRRGRGLDADRLGRVLGADCHRLGQVLFEALLGPLQILPHRLQILIPRIRIFLQRAIDDADHFGVETRARGLERRRVAVHDLVEDAVLQAAGKRLAVGEQLVQDRADGEDVAPPVDDLPGDLLGRHVVERADQHAGLRHAGLGDARDAEVEDLDRRRRLDHDVGRLDVAVDDARLVREAEAGAELLDQLQLARDVDRQPRRG